MQENMRINVDALRDAIGKSGYSTRELSTIVCANDQYVAQVLRRGTINEEKLAVLCAVLRVNAKDLLAKETIIEERKSQAKTNDELKETLAEIAKLLKEEVEVRTRSEAKISEILLEIQKMGTRSNKYYGNMENWKKFGHF